MEADLATSLDNDLPESLNLFIHRTDKKGNGVFTARDFHLGQEILIFSGNVVDMDEVSDHALYLQIGKRSFLGSSGGLDDYVNHSCEPNCGIVERNGRIILVAISEISEGQEITFDYSTWMEGDYWEMDCSCRSSSCRGKVKEFKCLPADVKLKYIELGIVPEFVLES